MKIKIETAKTKYTVETEDPWIAHLIEYIIKKKRLKFAKLRAVHRFLISMDEALGITSKIVLKNKDIHDFSFWNYQPKENQY